MARGAHGAECDFYGSLPCSFGGCTFSLDADQFLERTGSCADTSSWLYLNSKNIRGLREGVFDNMGSCTTLYLWGNRLSSLPAGAFSGLSSLTYLSLNGNELSSLPAGAFSGLTSLRTLYLDSNELSSLPAGAFSGLSSLRTLGLSGNRLSTLPAGAFSGLSRLEELYLWGNRLSSLPAGAFSGLSSLTWLYVRCDPSWSSAYCAAASDNAALTCVPLTQASIAGLSTYYGPTSTCEYSDCEAGYAGPVGGSCALCAAGTYTYHSGATVCIACPAGTYAPQGASECMDCGAGKYVQPSPTVGATEAATCIACGAGKYSPTVGATEAATCIACGAGKYSPTVGATEAATCIACGVGKYLTTQGNDAEADCVLCECSSGLVRNGCGGTLPGVCESCGACPSGENRIGCVGSAPGSCVACDSGTYKTTSGTEACRSCPAGTFSSTAAATSIDTCQACAAGKYAPTTGNDKEGACVACGRGKYSASEGASSESTCQECAAGKYLETEGSDAEADCISCEAGMFATTAGATSLDTCQACGAGKYASTTGNNKEGDCVACGSGKYSTSEGASSESICEECPANSASPAASSALSDCKCNTGSTGPDGGPCTPCVAGKFKATSGSSLCTACEAGRYSASVGATSNVCQQCDPGCEAGEYQSSCSASSGLLECTDCTAVPGYYCAAGSSYGSSAAGVACPQGYFCLGGAQDKKMCNVSAGWYCPSGTATVNGKVCPAGFYCTGGPTNKVACSGGMFSATEGSTSVATCSECVAGKFAPEGSSGCTKCAPGTIAPALGTATCDSCKPGEYTEYEGSVSCMSCPAGKTSVSSSVSVEGCNLDADGTMSVALTETVRFVVSLPMTAAEFDDGKQQAFKEAVARTAGQAVRADHVIIDKVEEMSRAARRLLAQGIRVSVSVKAVDRSAADAIAASLTEDAINLELERAGLPPATLLGAPTVVNSEAEGASALDSGDTASAGSASGTAVAVGIVVPVAVIMLVCAGWYFVRTRQKNSVETSDLEAARKRREEDAQRSRDEDTRTRREEEGEEATRREEARKRIEDQGANTVGWAEAKGRREQDDEQRKEAVNRVRLEVGRHSIDFNSNLGSGSFADVRRGTYRFPGQNVPKEVAYKIFRGGQNLPQTMRTKIEQELALGIQLNHKNLVKIYGVVEVPGYGPALVLELADRSLRSVLSDRAQFPSLPWSMRIQWLLGVASGMSQLHALLPKSIIHRDLKSANVLLSPDLTEAKITDFGVAMTLETLNSTLSAASGGGGAGTLAFKSPETFDGTYSEKSDVYAMGVTTYEVCTRTQPYEDLSQPEILDRAWKRFIFDEVAFEEDGVSEARQRQRWNKKHPLSDRRPNLDNAEEGCPASLIDWMVHCWADHADDRPTFEECVLFLQKLLEGRPYWGKGGDGERVVLSEGKEKEAVVAAFLETMPANQVVSVVKVERVQNATLWDHYAAMRRTMMQRQGAPDSYERTWLFHGTGEDTVVKIVAQGFNRNFGFLEVNKNALTMYGKGVYYAVNASYSSSHRYSKPNSAGEQQMFACRVLVGEYCQGKQDQPTPDVRHGTDLYDSTVDNVSNPEIFVAYHDAQAYPEYLITFKAH